MEKFSNWVSDHDFEVCLTLFAVLAFLTLVGL